MLEPPTPAGEPFGAQEEEESKVAADFETVCISLVERGWKIMPKKGTYPINKKGPRYVNLVDPRGNRKSVRVIDETLWGKLREAEARRTRKINGDQEEAVSSSAPETEAKIVSDEQVPIQIEESQSLTVQESPPDLGVNQTIEEISIQPTEEEMDTSQQEIQPIQGRHEIVSQCLEPAAKAEIVENPPKEFQSFALASPGLQKSIFDLGFETLLTTLQKETLSPAEIVSKIQEWSLESKNLLEFVHKWQEKNEQRSALPDTSEKDELISELQETLKETEDRLAETLRSLRQM